MGIRHGIESSGDGQALPEKGIDVGYGAYDFLCALTEPKAQEVENAVLFDKYRKVKALLESDSAFAILFLSDIGYNVSSRKRGPHQFGKSNRPGLTAFLRTQGVLEDMVAIAQVTVKRSEYRRTSRGVIRQARPRR